MVACIEKSTRAAKPTQERSPMLGVREGQTGGSGALYSAPAALSRCTRRCLARGARVGVLRAKTSRATPQRQPLQPREPLQWSPPCKCKQGAGRQGGVKDLVGAHTSLPQYRAGKCICFTSTSGNECMNAPFSKDSSLLLLPNGVAYGALVLGGAAFRAPGEKSDTQTPQSKSQERQGW